MVKKISNTMSLLVVILFISLLSVNVMAKQDRCESDDECKDSCAAQSCSSYKCTESISHCLFHCQHAKVAWFASELQLDTESFNSSEIQDIWNSLVEKFKNSGHTDRTMSIIAYLMAAIWKARNQFIFEGVIPDPAKTASEASQNAYEYGKIWDPESIIPTKKVAWEPPPITHLKLSTDASWNPLNNIGNGGWVLRDHNNNFIGGGYSKTKFYTSPLAAEADALKLGLSMSTNWNPTRCIAETDSLILVDSLQEAYPTTGELSHVIEDIKSISVQLGHVVFSHAPRACNTTAHCVAAFAKGATSDICWFNGAPPWLARAILRDGYEPTDHTND